jgi:hypothetical protein
MSSIRKLQWSYSKQDWGDDSPPQHTWTANAAPFGDVHVRTDMEDESKWRWDYCIAEYYSEATIDCDSADHGKQLAQEWFESLALLCLEVQP